MDGFEWLVGMVMEVVFEEFQYNMVLVDLRVVFYCVFVMFLNLMIILVEGFIVMVFFLLNLGWWVSNQVLVDQLIGLVVGLVIWQDLGEGIVFGDMFDLWMMIIVSVVDVVL